MKKGFTLIELLAVIVILAIIALIATPVILNIISDAKESANERSAELYADRLQKEIANRNLTMEFNPEVCIVENGIATCDGVEIAGIVSNTSNIKDGEIGFNNGKMLYYTLSIDGKTYSKGTTKEECFISTTPGEINGYNINDPECGSYVVIPSNLSLPISEVKYVFNLQRCEELIAGKPGFSCGYDDGDELTIDLNSEYWQMAGMLLLLVDRNYSIINETKYPVNSIGNYAFFNYELDNVVIPSTINNIGKASFAMNKIKRLSVPSSITTISESAFTGNQISKLNLPNSITEIKDSAFESNNLTSIVIPSNVTTIEDRAFNETSLTSVVIKAPKSQITTFGSDVFSWADTMSCSNVGTLDDTCITWQN